MANCLIIDGIARPCKDNSGGLKRVLIGNLVEITGTTPSIVTDNTGIVTGITMSLASKFYSFTPNKMSSNAIEETQATPENGTVGYLQTITLLFAKNEAAKRNTLQLMGAGTLVAIVEDFNGKYFIYGEENGLDVSGGSSATGTALTDMNGVTLVLTGKEHYKAREVTSSIIAGLL